MFPWPNLSAREPSMNTSIATITDAFRDAQRKAESAHTEPGSAQGSELGKWIIIAAAVFGALMLMRGMRRFTRLLFAFFWIWFWTHGASHYIF
jgi:hypothetical protein